MSIFKKIIPFCSVLFLSTFAQSTGIDPMAPAMPQMPQTEEKINTFITSDRINDSQKKAIMELLNQGHKAEVIKIIDQMNEIKDALETLPKGVVDQHGNDLSPLFAAVDQVADGMSFIAAVDNLYAAVYQMANPVA